MAKRQSVQTKQGAKAPTGSVAAVALLVLTALFFWEMFLGGKLPVMRDLFFDFLPQHLRAGEILRSGHLPLWSTYSGWGKPFAADPQTAAFYPLHGFFYFFPASMALRLYCAIHLWMAGAGMFALARQWRLDFTPALVVAISCMFSSWMIGCMEFANNFAAVVWAPWIIFVVCKLVDALAVAQPFSSQRARRLTAALAALFAVQYLTGYPEFVAYTGILAFAVIALECVCRNNLRLFKWSLGALALAGLAALLLAAVQLLLSVEFLRYSERATGIDPGYGMASFHPRHLWSLLVPFLNGRPGYPNQFWSGTVFEFWIGSCYVGIMPLALACCAGWWLPRRTDADHRSKRLVCIFLFAAGAFGLLMAFGQHTPLYKFLHDFLPGFNRFRFPSKFLVLVLFAISILAGFGCQALVELGANPAAARRMRKVILYVGSGATGALLLSYFCAVTNPGFLRGLTGGLFPDSPLAIDAGLNDLLLAIVFTMASGGTLYWFLSSARPNAQYAIPAVAFLNLFLITRGLQPMLTKSVLETRPEALVRSLADPANDRIHSIYGGTQQWLYASRDEELLKWAVQAGVGDAWLRFPLHQTWQGGQKLMRYKVLYSMLGSLPPAETERLADLLGIHYVLAGAPFEQIFWGGAARTFKLAERKTARPRAYLVADWIQMSDPEQIPRALLTIDRARQAIIETVSVVPEKPTPLPPAGANPGAVTSIKDSPNRLDLEVSCTQPALLVFNDAWYPGWNASVDGAVQPIIQTNYHFRGLFLQPGTHKVEMKFEPPHLWLGVGISASTALALALFAWLPPRRPSAS